ncbi:GNAT family N-acetyltransferase [Glycomyces harbinensis]|uniref:Acetyltransferase (GNAT) family protein n=1 Tax=Glycomyces harbinensis TaxID=58114 RepID=A0A1G6R3S3_9ACTN|nr:GNAT family N-acetyltransferase [Glycomyces harbinensis]SDC98657.1 Acetyltransferase (GNAT) family protein [Glycomyces harbinensis]
MAASSEVAAMLTEAFLDLPTAQWLVADVDERRKAVLGQFEILTAHAEAHGGIATAGDLDGAVVWFDHTTPPAPIPDYDERLRAACGEHTSRFAHLDKLMEHHHPSEPHVYVALVGVRRERRGEGLATAMLDEVHAGLDRARTSAYLEAVSPETAALYGSLGYRTHARPFHLEKGGPALYPMWRHPAR